MSATTATRPTTGPTPAADPDAAPGRSRRTTVLAAVVVLALAAGAAWWFVLRAPAEPEAPVPGEVLALEPIQVNLADGHYLSLGLALQLVEGAEEVDGSKALDAAIGIFSGRPVGELSQAQTRVALKEELAHALEEDYEEDVMGVYLTQFVTQ